MSELTNIDRRLAGERGCIRKVARFTVGLLKPSTYYVGMSSLGFQQVYKLFNACPDFCAQRLFLPDESTTKTLYLYESARPASNIDILAVSIAYELEIPALIRCFALLGISPLAVKRNAKDPLVIIGGPLSYSNLATLQDIGDAFVIGEAEDLIENMAALYRQYPEKSAFLEQAAKHIPEIWIPSMGQAMPPCHFVPKSLLPAYSQILSPETEFSNMFLIESERGCHRRCTFCVMRRGQSPGMRLVPCEKILSLIPSDVQRVGLVGAAVSDHPQLLEILAALTERGHYCSLSSLRTDKITPELVDILRASGLRTLTIAADGPSQRLRAELLKDVSEEALHNAAQIAAQRRMRVKVYVMIGLPGETDEDIDEFAAFMLNTFKGQSVSLGVSPFVAKRHTPLDGFAFAGIKTVDARIKRLRKLLKGRIAMGDVSAKWAYIEYCLAQGGPEMGHICIQAVEHGGNFEAWKRAMRAWQKEPEP